MPRPPRRHLLAAAACGLTVALAPTAQAATATHVLEGPSAALAVPGNRVEVAAAPDGSAAAVYRRTVAGQARVHVARRIDGVWQPGVRADEGVAGPAFPPAIAVANGGQVVVAFASGPAGGKRLHLAISPGPGQPFTVQQLQGDPGWSEGMLALSPDGDGYLVAHKNFEIRAFRLTGDTAAPVGAPFPEQAGNLVSAPGAQGEPGSQRGARLAVGGDGSTATIVWSESTAGGYGVFARRLTGTAPAQVGAAVPYDLATLAGHAAGGTADMPDVAVAGDGTAWVSMRQDFVHGAVNRFRALVRTFDGAAAGSAQVVDGLGAEPAEGTEFPRLAVNAGGMGLAGSYRQLTNGAELSLLRGGAWGAAAPLSPAANEVAGQVAVALSDSDAGLTAHLHSTTAGGEVRVLGRTVDAEGRLGAVEALSDPALGDVAGSVDSAAAGALAHTGFIQGAAATTRLVIADTDLPVPVVPDPTPPGAPANPGGGAGAGGAGGPGGTGGPGTAPTPVAAVRIGGLRVVPRAVRRGTRPPRRLAAGAAATIPSIHLTLSRAARVRLVAQRRTVGRRVGGRCRPATAATRRAAACVRWVGAGRAAILQLPRGASRIRFEGRLGGPRALPRGTYRLLARATTAAANTARTPFVIRPAPRR